MLGFIGEREHFPPFGVDDVIFGGVLQQLGMESFNSTEDIPLAAEALGFFPENYR